MSNATELSGLVVSQCLLYLADSVEDGDDNCTGANQSEALVRAGKSDYVKRFAQTDKCYVVNTKKQHTQNSGTQIDSRN